MSDHESFDIHTLTDPINQPIRIRVFLQSKQAHGPASCPLIVRIQTRPVSFSPCLQSSLRVSVSRLLKTSRIQGFVPMVLRLLPRVEETHHQAGCQVDCPTIAFSLMRLGGGRVVPLRLVTVALSATLPPNASPPPVEWPSLPCAVWPTGIRSLHLLQYSMVAWGIASFSSVFAVCLLCS